MSKVKFSKEEIDFINKYNNNCYSSRSGILTSINRNYQFGEEVKPDWFDNIANYAAAADTVNTRDKMVRKIIAKLNQISDKEWNKLFT